MQKLVKVKAVHPLEGFVVRVTFETGESREINLEKYLAGPVFAPIRSSAELFGAVRLERGVLTWGEGETLIDIDPDVLYYDLLPARLKEAEAA